MEIRISLGLMVALMVTAWGLSAHRPRAVMAPHRSDTGELAAIEDEFARNRDGLALGRRLAANYLRQEHPGLAIAAIRAADAALLADPILSHRLAQAYEKSGRLDDAVATANLALARCGRALGTREAGSVTRTPAYGCSAGEFAVIERHQRALLLMNGWGVQDPRTDPRAKLARLLSERRARLATAVSTAP